MKVLVCEPDISWSRQIISGMRQYGIDAEVTAEPSELWNRQTEAQGVLVNLQEIESMLLWGSRSYETLQDSGEHMDAVKSLCEQGRKVVVVLPALDYGRECACFKAGVAECIYKGQPMDLIMQRLLRVFWAELTRDVLWFGGVCCQRTEGKLTYQRHSVRLTRMERQMTGALFENGAELTRKQDLLMLLWGRQEDIYKHRLDTMIKTVRQKLQGFPIEIRTCYGRGYYLEISVCNQK